MFANFLFFCQTHVYFFFVRLHIYVLPHTVPLITDFRFCSRTNVFFLYAVEPTTNILVFPHTVQLVPHCFLMFANFLCFLSNTRFLFFVRLRIYLFDRTPTMKKYSNIYFYSWDFRNFQKYNCNQKKGWDQMTPYRTKSENLDQEKNSGAYSDMKVPKTIFFFFSHAVATATNIGTSY